MREGVLECLQLLKTEVETGQQMLAELAQQRGHLEQTLLRISGAIQVLEERLMADKVAVEGSEATVGAAKARAQ